VSILRYINANDEPMIKNGKIGRTV